MLHSLVLVRHSHKHDAICEHVTCCAVIPVITSLNAGECVRLTFRERLALQRGHHEQLCTTLNAEHDTTFAPVESTFLTHIDVCGVAVQATTVLVQLEAQHSGHAQAEAEEDDIALHERGGDSVRRKYEGEIWVSLRRKLE